MRRRRLTPVVILIWLSSQLIIGVIFFVPRLRLEILEGVPLGEIIFFYALEWLITTAWFLSDFFRD
jgi:hypothetical protein